MPIPLTVRSVPRRVLHGCGVLVVAATVAACSVSPVGGDPLDRVRQSGTLRVAMSQANPPWNFVDTQSRPQGYDVDVAREVGRRIGVSNVEFVGSNFQSFIEGVRAGRFDMVISGQTITPERRQQVDFSRPYEVNGISIFTKSDGRPVSGLGELAGLRVGVSAGTTQEKMARNQIRDADVRTYDNATLGLTDLARGAVDAFLVSRFQGAYLTQRNGLAVRPSGELLEREVNGMTFTRDSPRFKQAVDDALAGMIGDGTLTAISQRWLGGLDMAAELKALPPDQNH